MSIIKQEIDDLKEYIPKLRELDDEYLFSLVCLKYFYKNGRLDYSDYDESFVDGRNDGGIDLITLNEDLSDNYCLLLIQSKYIQSLSNKQEIVDIFIKIDQTVKDFKELMTANYNKRLKRIFKEQLNVINDYDSNIELVLFINTTEKRKRVDEIYTLLKKHDNLQNYQINIYYKNEIEKQIENIKEPKSYVEDGKIKYSKDDKILYYSDNGILVNIYANSLRDLYDQYRDRGLFEQNFRYYIRNKKIDTNIIKSLTKKRQDFWFLNNGIIIGCKEWWEDGAYISMINFSIINGCQTATLIGEYKGKNQNENFVIPCKIIKPKEEDKDDPEKFIEFIGSIAEATNSQKPISDRDLKSNSGEQKNLQNKLKERNPKIYLEIKRGQNIAPRSVEKWQKIKNDFLGQLILSFNLQQPGTARSSKRKIFAVDDVYRKIFKRTPYKDNIVDIIKLYDYYLSYLNRMLEEESFTGLDQQIVAQNGKFFILAIIGFFLKIKRGFLNPKIYSDSDKENWERELEKDDLTDKIFKLPKSDEFDILLESLFTLIINELSLLYQSRENEEKTVSNFFKTDNNYRNIIQKHLIQNIFLVPYKKKYLDKYLEIFI